MAHLDADDVALTGGAAIELHLAAAGRPARRAVVGDLDFLARCLKAIPPSVARDFLVSHYHRARPGVPKAMIQLVDPTTRMRIDIFSDSAGVIPRAQRTTIEGTVLNVLDARSIFDHKVQMLRTASPSHPVDSKHWDDAVALAELCGLEPPPAPTSAVRTVYCTDVNLTCPRCELSRTLDFPLAPKSDIFALLGYV